MLWESVKGFSAATAAEATCLAAVVEEPALRQLPVTGQCVQRETAIASESPARAPCSSSHRVRGKQLPTGIPGDGGGQRAVRRLQDIFHDCQPR